MQFEWDAAKSEACFAQRGFDFAYALQMFLDQNRLVSKDSRWDYGEERYRMLGLIGPRVFCVTYTLRGSVIRIISARKANRREILEYESGSGED